MIEANQITPLHALAIEAMKPECELSNDFSSVDILVFSDGESSYTIPFHNDTTEEDILELAAIAKAKILLRDH